MDNKLLFILIGILFLALVSLTVIIILFVKSRKKWKLNSQNQYLNGKEDGKKEAVSIIKETINSIENDKNKLNQMSEKELMVSTMMALASYGRRLDETNARLETITDYKSYISEMNKQMEALSESYENLQTTVKTAESSLNNSIMSSQTKLNESVEASKNSIDAFNVKAELVSGNLNILNTRLSSVGDIRQRVDEINGDLSQSLELLRSLQIQSSSIMSEMNGMLESYGQSPIAKIDKINHNVAVLANWVEELHRKFEYVSGSDLEKIEEIHSRINELHDKFSYVSSSDLDRIDDIYSAVDDLYDKFSNINSSDLCDLSKLSDINSKVDDLYNKFSCVNSCDFYDLDKISDINSKVDDVLSRLG